jgi:glutamate synthase domain-containing protein 1
VAQPANQEREFDQIHYLTRKEIERRIAEPGIADCYISSFSSRTIVYKGLMAPSQLGIFYKDLEDPEFKTSAALFPQR